VVAVKEGAGSRAFRLGAIAYFEGDESVCTGIACRGAKSL
jgi:hypothetical protein